MRLCGALRCVTVFSYHVAMYYDLTIVYSTAVTMSHVALWVDTSGRGVRGPVYNTVDNANWHRTCAYTPYIRTRSLTRRRAPTSRAT